jgi:transcription termination/antitermination protein NusG
MENESKKNWYILFVRGGREKKIINGIKNLLKSNDLEKFVNEIKIIENESENGKGKNLLPGYIFVNCEMNREILETFYSVPEVISFLKHAKSNLNSMPDYLSVLEVNNFLFLDKKKKNKSSKNINQINPDNGKKKINFVIGDLIKIKEGFFKDFKGSIVSIDDRKYLATINVDFLGRSTPVSVKFTECEKV